MHKLEIEMVPTDSWGENLRKAFTEDQWKALRKMTYKNAGHTCEVCGASNCEMQAHEVWSYDKSTHIQSFVRLESLCEKCHTIKHIGLALSNYTPDKIDELLEHLKVVNRFDDDQVIKFIKEAFALWNDRNKHKWHLEFPSFEELLNLEAVQ